MPFFSGEFDDPNYDDVNNPTSQAGITCTTCHAITNVNNTRGNAAYTIEEPQHYPFAFSDDPLLQWINNALVKAKPEMHKKTFLKPVIKDFEVLLDLPQGRPALRRQPLQGFRPRPEPSRPVSACRAFRATERRASTIPPVAKANCVECHMELKPSTDFGAKDFDGKGGREIHDHLFIGANTGLAAILGDDETSPRARPVLERQEGPRRHLRPARRRA